MVHTRPSVGTIIRINWRFLWAYLWGWLAFVSWPFDPGQWEFEGPMLWGLYLISVLCGLICWCLLRGNFCLIATNLRRDREVVKFNKRGAAPRSDRMANRNDLKSGGLLR